MTVPYNVDEVTSIDRWRSAEPTYPDVGATRTGRTPAGMRAVARERIVGQGEADFAAVAELIHDFGLQRGAGLRVQASSATAEVGTTVVLSAPFLGPIEIPCRVVYVLEEDDRAGFAYGTLDGHPECGEELFSVELRPEGQVVAVIRAFSRPARWYSRLGAPFARLLQDIMTRRYLDAAATRL